MYYERLMEQYYASLEEKELKAKEMPPGDVRACVVKVCDAVRDELIKAGIHLEKIKVVPYGNIERIDSYFDSLDRMLFKG